MKESRRNITDTPGANQIPDLNKLNTIKETNSESLISNSKTIGNFKANESKELGVPKFAPQERNSLVVLDTNRPFNEKIDTYRSIGFED